jgi:hypothetical protein
MSTFLPLKINAPIPACYVPCNSRHSSYIHLALIVTLILSLYERILCDILYIFASFSSSYTVMEVRNFIHLITMYIRYGNVGGS